MTNSREDLGYTKPGDAPEQAPLFGEIASEPGERLNYVAKLAELQRELDYRKRLYPRWIEQGKLAEKKAAVQIGTLEQIIEDYKVRPWPQTKQFVAEWRAAAERVTFMGVRLRLMHREELLAVVAYAKHALEEMENAPVAPTDKKT